MFYMQCVIVYKHAFTIYVPTYLHFRVFICGEKKMNKNKNKKNVANHRNVDQPLSLSPWFSDR